MLIRKLRFLTFLIALSLTAFGAEKGDGSITLAEALARTLRESPALAAYSYQLRAAEARILQAGLRPNPELSFDTENPTGSGPFKSGATSPRRAAISRRNGA